MSKSENLKEAAAEEDNDLKALGLMTKSLREDRLERFVDEFLPQLEKKGYKIVHDEQNHRYTIDTNSLTVKRGKIDFYPKSNKICIHTGSEWVKSGLRWIVQNLIQS